MFMVVIITVLLIISLIAVVLSTAAIGYAIFESKKVRDTEQQLLQFESSLPILL